jgi:hypothetical protein
VTALIQYAGLQLFAGLPVFEGMTQPHPVSQRDDIAVLRESTTELHAWRARAESRLSPAHAEELRAFRALKGNHGQSIPRHTSETTR